MSDEQLPVADAVNARSDTFLFCADFGRDVIADFDDLAVVQIDRGLINDFEILQSHMAQEGDSVVITLETETAEIQNVARAQLQADDFRFL